MDTTGLAPETVVDRMLEVVEARRRGFNVGVTRRLVVTPGDAGSNPTADRQLLRAHGTTQYTAPEVLWSLKHNSPASVSPKVVIA